MIGPARLRADLLPNIAGRAHASGRFTDPGNRLRRPGTWPGNSTAAPHAAVARFGFQRAFEYCRGTAWRRPAATPAPNLTHMSLEADAHVMRPFPGPLNADAYVIFHTR